MRALIQRVSEAAVSIDGTSHACIGRGYLVLLGVRVGDTRAEAQKLWAKMSKLRIFPDDEGKTNLSLHDVKGDLLVVSQFTLLANCRKGTRPSFTEAASPDVAIPLYEEFVGLAVAELGEDRVATGVFGADMSVSLVNDGPFTIWLDTDEL